MTEPQTDSTAQAIMDAADLYASADAFQAPLTTHRHRKQLEQTITTALAERDERIASLEKKFKDIEETEGYRAYMRGYNAANKERSLAFNQGEEYGRREERRALLAEMTDEQPREEA